MSMEVEVEKVANNEKFAYYMLSPHSHTKYSISVYMFDFADDFRKELVLRAPTNPLGHS